MSKIRDIIKESLESAIAEFSEPKLPYQNELKGIGNGLRAGKLGMQEWLEMLTRLHDRMIDDDMSLEEVNAIDNVFKRELVSQLS